MLTNLRNAVIVLAIAAAIWGLPGGGDAADVVGAALSAAFLCLVVFIGMRLYRDHRTDIYALGDLHRGLLYACFGAFVTASAALSSGRLDGALVLVWIAIACACVLGLYRVWLRHRESAY